MILLFVLLVTIASVADSKDLEEVCPWASCVLSDANANFSTKLAPNIKTLTFNYEDAKVLELTPNVRRLEMYGCNGKNLENLPTMEHLRWVTIFGSKIPQLHNDKFVRMPNLIELNLMSDSIETLTNGTFRNLSRLSILSLKWNLIKVLPDGVFRPLINLESIDLTDNKISCIEADTFVHNRRLTWLYLSNNPVKQLPLPREFFGRLMDVLAVDRCPQLKSLQLPCDVMLINLENSGVKTLKSDKEIYDVRLANNELTHLDLQGSQSEETLYEKILCELPKLEWLDLSRTKINTPLLRKIYGRCSLPNLKFLNISSNQLDDLPPFTPNVVTLDLSNNKLDRITGNSLKDLRDLQVLRLEGNNLKSFAYLSFHHAHTDLKELALYDNKFDSDSLNETMHYFHVKDVHLIQKDNQTVPSVWSP